MQGRYVKSTFLGSFYGSSLFEFVQQGETMKKWVTKNGYEIYQIIYGRSNSFLLSNGEKFILIDTGRENKYKTLVQRIEKLVTDKNALEALFLTHTHFDHVENAAAIKDKFGTQIYVHETEAEFLRKGENPRIKGTNFIAKVFTDLFGTKFLSMCKYRPIEYNHLIHDKYSFELLGFNAYAIHTPGHTVGSISLVVDNQIAIVGDAMYGIFTAFPPTAENPKLMIESWGKLLDSDCTIFLPSHGTANSRDFLQRQYTKYKKRYGL